MNGRTGYDGVAPFSTNERTHRTLISGKPTLYDVRGLTEPYR